MNVVFEAASILSTITVLRTAFINKSDRSIEPKRSRLSGTDRPVLILTSFGNATVAHIGLTEAEKDKEENVCDVAKETKISQNLEAICMMTNKSAGTYTIEARLQFTVRTCLLIL